MPAGYKYPVFRRVTETARVTAGLFTYAAFLDDVYVLQAVHFIASFLRKMFLFLAPSEKKGERGVIDLRTQPSIS